MQGFKKVLVALLVVATILGTIGPVFAAPKDVAGTKYEDAAVRLIALGIFKGDDKGNFNPDMPISRAEAAAVVIRALGLEKSADLMKGVTRFADVNADPGLQWATGAINIAVSQGIVNGYPDGRFGGRDNVTYAQLAKMILYALNYGVTVEGGVWPTAVLAKADDLGMLDGLAVVANAPITRGDAAKMLDNSLDIPSLKQTGYGDLKQFEETGKTLLERMGLDEIEGRVVEIPAVASGLDDDEVTIAVTKVNGTEQSADDKTYTQISGVDVQSLFGLEVKAWVNDDDEIVFVEKKTADKDIYTDTIKELVDKDEVKLDILDDEVTLADDAVVYVNYNKKSVKDATKDLELGLYGRFVQKNNKIVFANLFDFTGEPKGAVVTSVDGKKIKYFTTSEKERTLDLTDADAINVYDASLAAIDLDDIKTDDVIFWWEDSDEYHIVVAATKVEGTLEKIKDTSVTIDGKSYTMQANDYNYATYSLNDDDEVKPYDNNANTIKDLNDEEVVALLDLKGHVRHLRGVTDKTSGTQYGIVVGAPYDDEVRIFTKDGEEVKYPIEARGDYGLFPSAGEDGYKFYADYDQGLKYALVAYKVTSDGEVAESDDSIGLKKAVIVAYDANKDPDVTPAVPAEQHHGTLTKSDDEEFVTLSGGKKFYVDEDTVIMRALDDTELDPEVISWNDFKDLEITAADNSYAVVFGENNRTAKFIVFVEYNFQGYAADTYYGVLLDDAYRSGGKWKADVDVFGLGNQTYTLSSDPSSSFKEGAVVSFKLNAKGELDKPTVWTTSGTVDEDGYITVGGDVYKIHRDAVIYQLDSDGDIDRALSIADLEDKNVKFVADGSVVKAVTFKKTTSGSGAEEETEYMGVIKGVNPPTVRIEVNGTTKTYSLHENCIYEGVGGSSDLAVNQKVNFELIEGTSVIGWIEVVQ